MSPTTRQRAAYSPTASTLPSAAPRSVAPVIAQSYSAARRHSLYGIEDRVVIDPGSRLWKAGFSGEGRPRDVFYAEGRNGSPLWTLNRESDLSKRPEEDRLLDIKLEKCLRTVFHKSLLTDPRARKVILVESPLLPLHIKDALARILFENLQVLSVSFASSHLLSLLSVGRITGLVIDCGHLESTTLPIFASRPLFPQLRTTPLAGSRFSHHLRALLLLFGTYRPPATSLSAAANIPAANRSTRVPQELLTDALIEEIKTRCCFVGASLDAPTDAPTSSSIADEARDIDLPPQSDATHSESDFSHHSGPDSNISSQGETSDFSQPRVIGTQKHPGESHLQALATMYMRHSTATDIHMRVDPPPSQQTGTGRGTLIIPGWIRERAAEVLFEGGDVDESSVAELILDALLKVPIDLRKTMASSILCIGGTLMLPGFIPRLQTELIKAISAPPSSRRHWTRPEKPPPPPYDRFAPLRSLTPCIAILNNPCLPLAQSEIASQNAGNAPAFAPSMMAWVGGSLAGALKTGGIEVTREKWDEANRNRNMDVSLDAPDPIPHSILPDWTRTPLSMGRIPVGPQVAMNMRSPSTAIGA